LGNEEGKAVRKRMFYKQRAEKLGGASLRMIGILILALGAVNQSGILIQHSEKFM
jgi:hypothetical protein